MAEKKYLDLVGLGQYDSKIKTLIDSKDAATLKSAKDYADGLASNYEAKGAAATAEANAKGYTDGKVAELNQAISTANGKAVAAQSAADKAQAAADKAQGAADKAQGEVDALETLVGTLPADVTATTIVGYVEEKTSGIASEGAMTALAGRVKAIEDDYLVGQDRTDLMAAIEDEAERAAEEEGKLSGRLEKVETFFKTTEGEKLDEALDTLVEIQTYLEGEGDKVEQLLSDVAGNKTAIEKEVADRGTAISGVETAYKAADEAIDARLKLVEAAVGDEGSVEDMIDAAVAAEAKLREEADTALDGKISANAAAAKKAQEEVDALEGVVSALDGVVATKATKEEHGALAGRVTTAEGKITTLEGASHTHTNKDDLDGITATLIGQWNEAYTKAHVHANADVLAGISSQLVSNWNAAEGNAKAYTDEKIGEFVAITSDAIDGLFA